MLVTLVDDSIPFNGMTPAYQPIGGAEKAFASLPAALARQGHVVRAVNRSPNSLGFENVSWIHWEGRKPPITEVLIAFRKPLLLEFTRATRARILWVTGPPDYLHRPPVHEVLSRTDAKLVFLGNTHSEAYRSQGENAIYYRSIAPGVREEYRSADEMTPDDPPHRGGHHPPQARSRLAAGAVDRADQAAGRRTRCCRSTRPRSSARRLAMPSPTISHPSSRRRARAPSTG